MIACVGPGGGRTIVTSPFAGGGRPQAASRSISISELGVDVAPMTAIVTASSGRRGRTDSALEVDDLVDELGQTLAEGVGAVLVDLVVGQGLVDELVAFGDERVLDLGQI